MVAPSNNINDFKKLLSNSYRSYSYDISFTLDDNTEPPLLDDVMDELIVNNKDLSLICKSVGKLESEILEQKIEIEGRDNVTAGKFKYKSPIVIQFYDVVLGQVNGVNYMTSDLFQHWVERWNLDNPLKDNEKLYTRRRYVEDNSLKLKISLYNGNYTKKTASQFLAVMSDENIKDMQEKWERYSNDMSQNTNITTAIDKWQYFWNSDDVERYGGFEFMKSINGVGGSGITIHGLINAYVFTFIKALTISEMFTNLAKDVKNNEFDESAGEYALKQLGDIAGVNILHEKPGMTVDDITNPSANRGSSETVPRDLFESQEFIREMYDYLTSRSFNVNLIQQLNELRSNPSFGETRKEIITIINKSQFENPEQKANLIKILNVLMDGNINQNTAKELGDLVDQYNEFISVESLEEIKKQLNAKLQDSATSTGSFINEDSVDLIKKVISSIESILSSPTDSSQFYNETKKQEIEKIITGVKSLSDLSIINSPVDTSKLELFLKGTKFDRGSIGWHLKSRNYFAALFFPASAFIRAVQAKDNLKSFFNLMMPNNGWDDFINSEEVFPGVSETSFMRNTEIIKSAMREMVNSTLPSLGTQLPRASDNKSSYWSTRLIPGSVFENLRKDYFKNIEGGFKSFVNEDAQNNNQGDGISILRQFALTRCFPTNVNMQPDVSNDKTGADAFPVIEVSFNFYNIIKEI